jgi:hypothetical protein
MDIKEADWEGKVLIYLAGDWEWRAVVDAVMNFRVS